MPLQKQASFSEILYGHTQTMHFSRESRMVMHSARLAPTRKSLFAHHRTYTTSPPPIHLPQVTAFARSACHRPRASQPLLFALGAFALPSSPFRSLEHRGPGYLLALKRPYTPVRSRVIRSTRCSATLAPNAGHRRRPAARAVGEDFLIEINSVYFNLKI